MRWRRAQHRESTTRPLTSHADDIRSPPASRKAAREGLGLRRDMADLPVVTPDYFEILVVRELRKVGFEVGASGWGPSGHYPAWLPAYLAQVVDRDSAGQVRSRLLEAGRADLILDQWQQPAEHDRSGG